jgi:hypothetical protein
MAARGVAPLPPAELVVVLYQLAALDDAELAAVARKTAAELPDPVLAPALQAGHEPRVLDFYSRLLAPRPKLLQLVLLNAETADETFAHLASTGADELLEVIGRNEQRLLRHPDIITALYLNPRTRMSTATRALELAVRNNVEVSGIPSFDALRAAIASEGVGDEAADFAFSSTMALFAGAPPGEPQPGEAEDGIELPPPGDEADEARAMSEVEAMVAAGNEAADKLEAGEGSADDKAVAISKLSMSAKVRLATLGNAFARAVLVRDSNRVVAMAAIRSPSVGEKEVEAYAANRGLNEDVIRFISGQRHFVRHYPVKRNLVNNPKCPLQVAIAFLNHLTPKDLRSVARSKSIPSALARAARALMDKREQR